MKIVFFSKDAQFQLTDEEFVAFMTKVNEEPGKKIYIPRLDAYLSDMFIWAGEKPLNPDEMRLHDGTIAVRKFGSWIDRDSSARLDPTYYPEIAKDYTPEPKKDIKYLS
ncbi:MAG TPA: hypothetical protein PK698_06500 [Bacilli bacterium]|nr:hypothetical protein [Bacilli bacterium]